MPDAAKVVGSKVKRDGKKIKTFGDRPSACKRGYGRRWRKASKAYLRRHPLCAMCEKEGRVEAATVVDHVVPHCGNMKLFWDPSNWQGLSRRCHAIKSAPEDGGFGNEIRI